MRTVIVSGGHIEDAFAAEWIKEHNYDYMIAADRGMEFFHRNGLAPNLIVGDFDSVSGETLDYFRDCSQTEMITLNPVKDDTDTEFAIRTAIEKGATDITLLGATGSRIDHVLGNIELLAIGLENHVSIEMMDAHNRIRMIEREISIEQDTQFGKYVSLIPYTKEVSGLSLEGFQYSLQNYTLRKGCTLGVSNEIAGKNANIKFDEGILLMIESRD